MIMYVSLYHHVCTMDYPDWELYQSADSCHTSQSWENWIKSEIKSKITKQSNSYFSDVLIGNVSNVVDICQAALSLKDTCCAEIVSLMSLGWMPPKRHIVHSRVGDAKDYVLCIMLIKCKYII